MFFIQGREWKTKVPANNRTLRSWKNNLERYGSVLAPQNGSKGRERPTLLTARLDAPPGSQERRLAVKKGQYDLAIAEVRGCIIRNS